MAVAVPVALAVAVAVAARQVGERRREAGEGGGGSSALFKTSTQPRRVGKKYFSMFSQSNHAFLLLT